MMLRLLFSGIVVALLSSAGFAADKDPVLAKAGDYVFRQSDFERLLSFSPPGLRIQLLENPEQRVTLIEKIIQQKVIADRARKEGLDKTEDVREQLRYITDDFLVGEYVRKVSAEEKKNIRLKEDELRQYYIANTNIFTIPEQVKARHILIKVSKDASDEKKTAAREKAKEIYKKLKQGEDFEKLAEQFSEDLTSRSKRGDLGYILRGQMEQPFEDAAFSLKPGEFSYIVETSQGYHIIFSEAYIKERVKTFDEVRDVIDSQVRERLVQARLKDHIKKLMDDAQTEIFRDNILGEEGKQ